jgi:hypothetical protein
MCEFSTLSGFFQEGPFAQKRKKSHFLLRFYPFQLPGQPRGVRFAPNSARIFFGGTSG